MDDIEPKHGDYGPRAWGDGSDTTDDSSDRMARALTKMGKDLDDARAQLRGAVEEAETLREKIADAMTALEAEHYGEAWAALKVGYDHPRGRKGMDAMRRTQGEKPEHRALTPRPGWTQEQEYIALSEEFFVVEENRDALAKQLERAVEAYGELAELAARRGCFHCDFGQESADCTCGFPMTLDAALRGRSDG